MTRETRVAATFLFACIVVLMPRASAFAQAAPELRAVDVDTSHYPEVSMTFEVPADVDGSWSATVVENGETRPASLQTGTSGGSEVVIVLDTSGSMAGAPLRAAKDASVSFVRSLPPETRVAVVGFGSSPYVVSPMTADHGVLEQAISGVRTSGDTALYDALGVAVQQFSLTQLPRSIVLVSDGGDTTSVASLDDVTRRLVDSEARVFGLRLATDETNDGVLAGLADATNGRIADAVDLGSLSSTFQEIASSALRQVRLTYTSSGHGPVQVDVRLNAAGIERQSTVAVTLPAAPANVSASHTSATSSVASSSDQSSRWQLLLGAAAFGAALLLLLYGVFVPQRKSLLSGRRRSRADGWQELKTRFGAATERALERRGRRDALSIRLEHAGISLRPGEYLMMAGAAVGIGAFVGLLLAGIGLALVFGALVALGAKTLLTMRTTKRRADIDRQLPDFLQQTTSSLRAGYGIMQALDTVARDSEEPLRGELRRVVHEVQLGRGLTDALEAMAMRVGGQDFGWVVQAIEINHEVGGDLVEVLDAVADTIRARAQLRRQIKTLSAQGRLSAKVLVSMPFVLGGLLSLLHPGWLTPLFTKSSGQVVVAIGGMMLVTGVFWMRRIVRLQY